MVSKFAYGLIIGYIYIYIYPLITFVDENNRQIINWDAKVHDFIDHDKNEWNLHSIGTFLPTNVIVDIKEVPIHFSPMEDRCSWGFSQDGRFTLKLVTKAMRKLSSHPRSKMLKWIWKLNLPPKIKFFFGWLLGMPFLLVNFSLLER